MPSGLGKHRMTGRAILGPGGGLGLGDEVHRLLERIEWGGLDPSWKENVPAGAWKLADDFCQSGAGREVFEKREGCRVWREKALEVLDTGNRLVAAAVDRAVLDEKKGGDLRIYDFKTDQVTDDQEWLKRHGAQLRKYAELLGGWWKNRHHVGRGHSCSSWAVNFGYRLTEKSTGTHRIEKAGGYHGGSNFQLRFEGFYLSGFFLAL